MVQKRQINHLPSQSTMACRLDARVYQKYLNLPTPGKVMATYIWIDGTGQVNLNLYIYMYFCAMAASNG